MVKLMKRHTVGAHWLTCVREKSHFLRRMQLSLADDEVYSFR